MIGQGRGRRVYAGGTGRCCPCLSFDGRGWRNFVREGARVGATYPFGVMGPGVVTPLYENFRNSGFCLLQILLVMG